VTLQGCCSDNHVEMLFLVAEG